MHLALTGDGGAEYPPSWANAFPIFGTVSCGGESVGSLSLFALVGKVPVPSRVCGEYRPESGRTS